MGMVSILSANVVKGNIFVEGSSLYTVSGKTIIIVRNMIGYRADNQNYTKMLIGLNTQTCKRMSKLIKNGATVQYIYLYEDAILTIPVDNCY